MERGAGATWRWKPPQVSRERTALTQEQTRLTNQMRGWLASWGCAFPRQRPPRGGQRSAIGRARRCVNVQARIARAAARAAVLEEQIAALDAQQQAVVTAAPRRVRCDSWCPEGHRDDGRIGPAGQGLVWRAFRNRRQIGGLLGLRHATTRETQREQGISRAGNNRLQAVSIQLGGVGCDGTGSALTCGIARGLGPGSAPPNWDCSGRAQARDRPVAVCQTGLVRGAT